MKYIAKRRVPETEKWRGGNCEINRKFPVNFLKNMNFYTERCCQVPNPTDPTQPQGGRTCDSTGS